MITEQLPSKKTLIYELWAILVGQISLFRQLYALRQRQKPVQSATNHICRMLERHASWTYHPKRSTVHPMKIPFLSGLALILSARSSFAIASMSSSPTVAKFIRYALNTRARALTRKFSCCLIALLLLVTMITPRA
ncbi:hypothetical protein BDZ89DRAFT_236676 [Hymenopellis radicata]|nr:hypothetical protein BDZ89DRAFT_236676 [Hymenopellis radicata]